MNSTQGIGILQADPQLAGCTDDAYIEYNASALVDDGSCSVRHAGCIDQLYLEYDPNAITPDPSLCVTLIFKGCTNPMAANYWGTANVDDGSCFVPGPITWRTSHMNTTTLPSTGPTWQTNHEVSWEYNPLSPGDPVPDSYEYEGIDHDTLLNVGLFLVSWPNNIDPATPTPGPATTPYSPIIYSGNLAFPVITNYDPTATGGPINHFHYRVRWVKEDNNMGTIYGPWVQTSLLTD